MSPMNLAEQLGAIMDSSSGAGPGNSFSLMLAQVTDIKDEKNLNRVKCLPIGAPDTETTDWCYVMAPMGGAQRGLFLFPQKDDLVVLGYIGGDPHRPIVLGSFWDSASAPPIEVKDGKAEDYCLKTPNNVQMMIHDEDSKQKLTVTMPSEAKFELDDENQKAALQDKDGNNALQMDLKNGEITLQAKSKLVLNAGKTTVTLEENGKITIKGSGDITIDGKTITGKAQGKLAMQGMDAEVKANKSLALSASGDASLKGATLKLN